MAGAGPCGTLERQPVMAGGGNLGPVVAGGGILGKLAAGVGPIGILEPPVAGGSHRGTLGPQPLMAYGGSLASGGWWRHPGATGGWLHHPGPLLAGGIILQPLVAGGVILVQLVAGGGPHSGDRSCIIQVCLALGVLTWHDKANSCGPGSDIALVFCSMVSTCTCTVPFRRCPRAPCGNSGAAKYVGRVIPRN